MLISSRICMVYIIHNLNSGKTLTHTHTPIHKNDVLHFEMFAFRTDVLSYFAAVQMMNTFYIKISTKFSDDTTSILLHFRVKLLAVSTTRSLSSGLFMFDTFYFAKFHSHLSPVKEKWFQYQFSWWREQFPSICSTIKRTSEHRIDVTANVRPVNVQCHRRKRVRTIHLVHASITTRTLY